MLKINCMDREELIKRLTETKGKVPPFTYIITIRDPGEQEILASKENVLSLSFLQDVWGPQSLSFNTAFLIFKFLTDVVYPSIRGKDDVHLWVQSSEGVNRAGAIGEFSFQLFPQQYVDVEHWIGKNLTVQGNAIILNRLLAVQMLYENFDMKNDSLPFIAYSILKDSEKAGHPASQKKEVVENAEKYLNTVFEKSITKLEKSPEWISLKLV